MLEILIDDRLLYLWSFVDLYVYTYNHSQK